MKDQNKNQKAPETKLTDEQLDEVNAGVATFGQGNLEGKRLSGVPIGLAAGVKVTMLGDCDQARFKGDARI